MPRTWSNTPRSIKDFERWVKPGSIVYVVNDHASIAGQFEKNTYSRRIARKDRLRGITFDGVTPKMLVCTYRSVSDTPPPGLRDLASPEPDCRDEGYGPSRSWQNEKRRLDADELKHLDKRSKEAAEQYSEDRKAGRRGRWF